MARPSKWSLRRNKAGKHSKGSWKLRITIQLDPKLQGRTVEVGLATTDFYDANARAKAIVKALESILLYKQPAGRITDNEIVSPDSLAPECKQLGVGDLAHFCGIDNKREKRRR